MTKKLIPFLIISLLIIMTLACGGTAPAATSSAPTVDTQATVNAALVTAMAATQAAPNAQATVDAAIAATQAAPNAQATVDAAIAATAAAQAAMQATVAVSVQGTAAAMPTPTPSADYVTMSEEELEALINQSVAEATAASQQASTATTQAASDATVTSEEIEELMVYAAAAEQAIVYAEEILYAYNDIYGALASESVAMMQAIEQDLAVMATNTATLNATLEAVNTSLEQGVTLATETITQLQTTAQQISTQAADAQAQVKTWTEKAKGERETRANNALSMQPDQIPDSPLSALLSGFDYVDTVRNSLADNKITRDELDRIAKTGANASAGFNRHGDAGQKEFSNHINQITGQLARGQNPQARSGVGNFERSLGSRPSPGSGGRSLPKPGRR
jgi:hypothetical protein